ncbi:GNAT family N-acetyltransferase [Paenibacillus sp. N1-5-1-14]|uniref:GNAT family N-acetyltransferase n=1 Tax=Paenibacillus radicibacter TaxID=2972488 RepID=UPI002158D06D|nr:GNAT family N-acetyltransferase [Paenibacillus radicibacter]MCR8644229.1 GNAT family N-acetyltransferase [Paenibacillus radicibacter]
MFVHFLQNDVVLTSSEFIRNEVQFNLIHRIMESDSATLIKSSNGQMIYAQTQGNPGWLWVSGEATADVKEEMLMNLVNHLKHQTIPGISGEPELIEHFAQVYSKETNLHYHTHMMMESYCCPNLVKPEGVKGELRKAAEQDIDVVAKFLVEYAEEAHGLSVNLEDQIPVAERTIHAGNLYLWIVEEQVVSMANIAHRSPRHGRINSVFTPKSQRKRGYASAITAEICSILREEQFIPVLYADLSNPTSNKIYQDIGFVVSGKIADVRFTIGLPD